MLTACNAINIFDTPSKCYLMNVSFTMNSSQQGCSYSLLKNKDSVAKYCNDSGTTVQPVPNLPTQNSCYSTSPTERNIIHERGT